MIEETIKRYMMDLLKFMLIITILVGIILTISYISGFMDHDLILNGIGIIFIPLITLCYGVFLGLGISRKLIEKEGIE